MTLPADPYEIAREVEALAEKATPGPWNVDTWVVRASPRSNKVKVSGVRRAERGVATTLAHSQGGMHEHLGNAALIAHCGTHYAALARELLRVEVRWRPASESPGPGTYLVWIATTDAVYQGRFYRRWTVDFDSGYRDVPFGSPSIVAWMPRETPAYPDIAAVLAARSAQQ